GPGAGSFPGNPAARPRSSGLGRDVTGADRRESPGSATNVRGVRRQCRRLRRPRRTTAGGLKRMIQNFLIYDALIAPFTEFEFMRRALAGVVALALGGAPI